MVLLTHTVWVLLATLLTLSLLGAAADTSAGLGQVSASLARTVTGDNVWLAAVTILDQALLGLSYGWLWAGLYFVLVTITAVTSLYGYVEVIASSFADIKPSLLRWKPLAVGTKQRPRPVHGGPLRVGLVPAVARPEDQGETPGRPHKSSIATA